MTIEVSTTDPRSLKALQILETADRWIRGRRKSDGRSFFAIPGSDGRVYCADTRECTCPDRQQRQVERVHHQAKVRVGRYAPRSTPPTASRRPAADWRPSPHRARARRGAGDNPTYARPTSTGTMAPWSEAL